ncbi:DJ-1/PfpI family protein [Methylocapsa acidiphila]|uniref:DJ-1/PfpI family protein n=1 Tax=Methylocapsa acidiphila TaxID=133552 RepID=UPI000686F901|nr:DJ-1/PfpI family protein [Methylocapsa acidiphila]
MDRRDFLYLTELGTAALLAPLLPLERAAAAVADRVAEAEARSMAAHEALAAVPGLAMRGNEQIAMLVYPGFTALDLVGPYGFFAGMMGATVHLVTAGTAGADVSSEQGMAIRPTVTMADVPSDLDLLFVPGGSHGTVDAMRRADIVTWLADRGGRAKYVTSVCTGSMLLGQAGLLNGRQATSHWATRELLPLFGATPVDARVVADGRFITGAGVTAGLDLALTVVEALRGRLNAQAQMLVAEYRPEPPFAGGTLKTTPASIAEPMRAMFAGLNAQITDAAELQRR